MGRGRNNNVALLINGIFYGAALIAALVVFLINSFTPPEQNYSGLIILFAALALLGCFKIRTLLKEDDRGGKFVWVLLFILGIIGALPIVAMAAVLIFSGEDAGTYLAVIFAFGLEWLLANFYVFSDSVREFFRNYGFMIFFPVLALAMFFAAMYINTAFIFLLILNLLLASVFLGLSGENGNKIAAFAVLGVVLVINVLTVFAGIGFDKDRLFSDGVYMFYIASSMFVYLTVIVCGLVRVAMIFLPDINEKFAYAMNFILPPICFGLQFLMFYYWKAAAITLAVVIVVAVVATFLWSLVLDIVLGIGYFFADLFTGKLFSGGGSGGGRGGLGGKKGGKKPNVGEVKDAATYAALDCHVELVDGRGTKGDITVVISEKDDGIINNFCETLNKKLDGYDVSGISVVG